MSARGGRRPILSNVFAPGNKDRGSRAFTARTDQASRPSNFPGGFGLMPPLMRLLAAGAMPNSPATGAMFARYSERDSNQRIRSWSRKQPRCRPQMIGRPNIVTQMPHELVPVATIIARLLDPTGRDNASARSFGDPHRLGALAASLLRIGRRAKQRRSHLGCIFCIDARTDRETNNNGSF
jgi:hypothetical protein